MMDGESTVATDASGVSIWKAHKSVRVRVGVGARARVRVRTRPGRPTCLVQGLCHADSPKANLETSLLDLINYSVT